VVDQGWEGDDQRGEMLGEIGEEGKAFQEKFLGRDSRGENQF